MADTIATPDGIVHLVCPIGGAEHTLCGIAMDAADTEADESLRWIDTNSSTVTCGDCGRVVLACRGVRVKAAA